MFNSSLHLFQRDHEDFEEKVQNFALKIVQMGISLKLLANGLTEIRTHLYEKMNDDKDTTQESHDLIWQIDRFITPIHNEILNQYSISWKKPSAFKNCAAGTFCPANPCV